MSLAFSDSLTQVGSRVHCPERKQISAGQLQCLVASNSESRLAMFETAAEETGWQARVCHGADQARARIARHRFQLAMIDLDGDPDHDRELREVAETLAKDRDLLLLISGGEDDPLTEIWARQLGCWVYLSGVDETCDVAMVFGEARVVRERLHPDRMSDGVAMGSPDFR